MFKKIKEFFTGTKPEVNTEAPYKVEPIPAGTEAAVITVPNVEAVVVVPEAVVPAAVVATAPAKKAPKAKTPATPKAVKVPKAPVAKKAPAAKKPRAPKAQ